jgi:tartrate-resistant acid phosphatase type 5
VVQFSAGPVVHFSAAVDSVTSVTDPQWQAKFELPYEDIELPFYVVLGNHDYGGNGVGNEFGKGQHEIDYSAVSAKWKLPAAYYSRTWRNVEIFGLDSNAQIFSMDAQQRIDIAAWLAASTATWRIVVGHHPYLSNGPHGNAGSYVGASGSGAGVKSFMEGVVCGNSDVHLSGHDHSMQWLTPTCAGTELIVSGAGAAPTTLPGSTPAYFQSTSLGFAYIVVDGNTFTVEFVDASGATLFTRSITKP